jgi:hypothetical protein
MEPREALIEEEGEEQAEEDITPTTGKRTIRRKKGWVYVYNVITGEVIRTVPPGKTIEYDREMHMIFLVHADKYSIHVKIFRVPKSLRKNLQLALRMALNVVLKQFSE